MTIAANIKKKNLITNCVIDRLIFIVFSFQSRNFISLIKTNIQESHCCSFLPVTLKIYLTLVYPCPISLCKHEQNLRRYLDVYV